MATFPTLTVARRAVELLTIGHGTLSEEQFAELLLAAGVTRLGDIRTAPGSRRVPHFNRAAMAVWLPGRGIAYRWEPRLGGWRRPLPESVNTGLRSAAFRGYADHMEGPDFAAALAELLAEAAGAQTAVMCAESLWWRCHRRLVSDAAVLLGGATVIHLWHDGSRSIHTPSPEAVVEGGRLRYPPAAAIPPPREGWPD